MNPEREDSELVRASLAGERDAYAVLVGRYQHVAFRAAYLITREATAAEEAAQDGFVRAFKSLNSFRSAEPFRPWLLRIVTNLALNHVRGRSRSRRLLERVGLSQRGRAEPPADEIVMVEASQRETWAAINRLSEDDRLILYLRYFLELSEKEMAVVIGKAPGTVKSRLNRASGRLRAVIESEYPGLVPAKGANDA
ncbi:MAG: RNA polymerase sigma factor [Dehalococcoidia bacterium]